MHLSAWADCTTDSHVTTLLPPCLTGGLGCTFPSPYFSHWYKFMFISLVQYDRRTVQMLLEAFWQSVICPSHSWVRSPLHVQFKVFDNHTPASLREYTLCVVRCCEVVFLNITVHFSCLLWSFRPFDVAEMASLLFSKGSRRIVDLDT